MKITTAIPLFINKNPDECFSFLRKTIEGIKKYTFSQKIRIFYCQQEQKQRILDEISIYQDIELIFIQESDPKYLPIDVFNFMTTNKALHDDEYIFYTENDHILRLHESILSALQEKLDRGYVIMPHRLGRTKCDIKKEYIRHNELWVGNNSARAIRPLDENFNEVLNYSYVGEHNDYAGCYFVKKSTIRHIYIPKYYGYIGKRFMKILGKRSLISGKFLPKRIHLKSIKRHTIPYGLILEAPSLTLSYRGLRIIKTKNIDDLYVEHLSNNGYV